MMQSPKCMLILFVTAAICNCAYTKELVPMALISVALGAGAGSAVAQIQRKTKGK